MNEIHNRARLLWWLIVGALGVFTARIFYLQVIQGSAYQVLAERNRFQVFFRQAPRGLVVDVKSRILAENVGVFNLYFNPNLYTEDLSAHAARVSAILRVPQEVFEREVEKTKQINRTRILLSQIPPTAAMRFMEVEKEFPEFFLTSESLRSYPWGTDLSHILGYLTKIQTKEEFEKLKTKGYRLDSWVGQFGLEKVFEDVLKGSDGAVFLEVDARGRAERPASKETMPRGYEFTQDPYPGNTIHLSLDGQLSHLAHQLLRESASGFGSVIGIEPKTGAIRVLAMTPGFDPNAYIRIADKGHLALTEYPRALAGTYPPGSVFKIITGIAALESEHFDPKRQFLCRGEFVTPRKTFKCWKKEGHGWCDFLGGVENSCDVYFYHMGLILGPDPLTQWAHRFGLGEPAAIRELPQWSARGFIPSQQWKLRVKKEPWFSGDSLNMAIGQGEVLASPLQLADLISTVANRGVSYPPHLVDYVSDAFTDEVLYQNPGTLKPFLEVRQVQSATWDMVEKGLALVVNEGTGRGAQIPGYQIYGKTATAQNPLGKDHAIFVCYLKDEKNQPRLALAVVVEHGGMGSVSAVPIAREILKAYIHEENIAPSSPS